MCLLIIQPQILILKFEVYKMCQYFNTFKNSIFFIVVELMDKSFSVILSLDIFFLYNYDNPLLHI